MSTGAIPLDGTAAAPDAARHDVWQHRGECGNCGFVDQGYFCSLCGERLHEGQASVLQLLWEDLVARRVNDLFALLKTTWLMLVMPRRFFRGVLVEKRGLANEPFPLSFVWRRVSHKPHGVQNPVRYFLEIWVLALVVIGTARLYGVDLIPQFHVPTRLAIGPLGDTPLPEALADSLILIVLVFLAWMYALALSGLLGGKVATGTLTRFLLYVNGVLLMFSLAAAVLAHGAGSEVRAVLALACVLLVLYAAFILPHVVLPKLFGVGRLRLLGAQLGAVVLNYIAIVGIVFSAAFVYAFAAAATGHALSGGGDDGSSAVTPAPAPPPAPILPADGSGGGAPPAEDPNDIKVIQPLTP